MEMNSSPSRDSHQNPTPKGKRRPFFGRVRAVFRHLFCHRKKNKAVRDPEEINAIPSETTDSKDIVSVPERETEATSGTEHVHASNINIGATRGTSGTETASIPESGIEIKDNRIDSDEAIQSTKATDIVETVPTLTDGIKSTVVEIVADPNDGMEISIPTETALIPESVIDITATKDNKIDSEESIQSTKATDIVETVPTLTDGIESTVVETLAEPKDGMEISIPTETASIPESRKSVVLVIEITITTDTVSTSETKTEVTNGTDNVQDHAVLRGKESVPPLTTVEEPAEEKPHPSGESVQPTQQNATPARRRRSFLSMVKAFVRGMRRKGIRKKQSTVFVLTAKSFKYHKHIGDGIYGKVFLASHPGIDQLLAIKVVHKSSDSLDALLLERKAMEVTGASRFFPQLYATFQENNFPFYVMEYVNGVTLREFIEERNPLDLDTIRFIAAELLCAIQFLHSRGIAHCDLHSQNVLLDRTGHIKIIDFGFAKMTGVPFCPGTKIDECLNEPWCYYLGDYANFRNLLLQMKNVQSLYQDNDLSLQFFDLIEECMFIQTQLRQHPFFERINWDELEAGNVRPPYIMEPSPKVNRSQKLKLDFSKCKTEISEVSGFDFVSDRWKEMLQHKEVRNQDQPRFIPDPKVRHH